ncbi:MAG: LLM class flavin-dependent oxidoreductase [Alicyclobacillus sp.]|nr:LLM class flavin-dependent oxidoreductase [Alicyclobacillus sp.]
MRFYHFSEMPYPMREEEYMPISGSARVTLPNRLIDPVRVASLYNDYLDEYEYADELGFDLILNEHHQTITCMDVQPSLFAASLIRRTTQSKILILGYPLPHRDNPLRVAEEVAVLDCLSRGRILCGFVRGVGMEHHPSNVNPVENVERFYEAHDLILKAWTHGEPFHWEGKYYHYRYANPIPRPYQQPHPPIWTPVSLNEEQIRWAAERQYVCAVFLSGFSIFDQVRLRYKEISRELGYPEPGPERFAYMALCYVAETDELAEQEGKELLWYMTTGQPHWFTNPPGYRDVNYRMRIYKPQKGGWNPRTASWQELCEKGLIIAGSPDTVAKKITQLYHEKEIGHLLMMNQAGFMSKDKVLKSIRLFATEVKPQVEHLGLPLNA